MTDDTAHYGALIRLQVTMSALQDILRAIHGLAILDQIEDRGDRDAVTQACDNAQAAIDIALGGRHDVPETLMRNWADAAMKRDASKVLAASSGHTP